MRKAPNKVYVAIGYRRGKLTVESELPSKNGKSQYLCRCDCGNTKVLDAYVLLKNPSRPPRYDCGCDKYARISEERDPNAISHMVYCGYKAAAHSRSLSFELSKVQVLGLFQKPCHYCGIINSNCRTKKYKSFPYTAGYYYNGIDRVDNSIGYTAGNTVSCCFECNLAKHTRGKQEFIQWVARCFKHLSDQNLIK